MTSPFQELVPLFIYAGLVVKSIGYLTRDELHWRPLLLMASGFQITYYYAAAGTPIWDAVITIGILASINASMIVVVLRERSTRGMAEGAMAIYGMFPMLSPGNFRRLMRRADHRLATGTQLLLEAGSVPDRLFFVVKGPVEIEKDGTTSVIEGPAFLAEIAFLTGQPASATVRVREGADYLGWDAAELHALLDRKPALRASFVASLNLDLAQKVTRSQPMGQPA